MLILSITWNIFYFDTKNALYVSFWFLWFNKRYAFMIQYIPPLKDKINVPVLARSIILASALRSNPVHCSWLLWSRAYLLLIRLLTQCNAAWTGVSELGLVLSLSVRTAVSRITPVARYSSVGRIATAPLRRNKLLSLLININDVNYVSTLREYLVESIM